MACLMCMGLHQTMANLIVCNLCLLRLRLFHATVVLHACHRKRRLARVVVRDGSLKNSTTGQSSQSWSKFKALEREAHASGIYTHTWTYPQAAGCLGPQLVSWLPFGPLLPMPALG